MIFSRLLPSDPRTRGFLIAFVILAIVASVVLAISLRGTARRVAESVAQLETADAIDMQQAQSTEAASAQTATRHAEQTQVASDLTATALVTPSFTPTNTSTPTSTPLPATPTNTPLPSATPTNTLTPTPSCTFGTNQSLTVYEQPSRGGASIRPGSPDVSVEYRIGDTMWWPVRAGEQRGWIPDPESLIDSVAGCSTAVERPIGELLQDTGGIPNLYSDSFVGNPRDWYSLSDEGTRTSLVARPAGGDLPDSGLRFGRFQQEVAVARMGQDPVMVSDFRLAVSVLPAYANLTSYVGVRFRVSQDDFYELRVNRVGLGECNISLHDSRLNNNLDAAQIWRTGLAPRGCDDGIEDYLVLDVAGTVIDVEYNGVDMTVDQNLGTVLDTLGPGTVELVTHASVADVLFVVVSEL